MTQELPDSTAQYVSTETGRPTKDFYNWLTRIKPVNPASGNSIINVKDYNARGDNSHDDTENIQDAIDASLAANAGIVWFPTGVYKTTSTITVPRAVMLAGTGIGSCLIDGSGGDFNVLWFPDHFSGIFQLAVNGKLNTSATAPVVLTADSKIQLCFRDCNFIGGLWGLQCRGVDCNIDNCFISGWGSAGGHLYNNNGANYYRRCKCDQTSPSASAYGIYSDSSTGRESHYDMCDVSGAFSTSAVHLHDGGTGTLVSAFTNCTFANVVTIQSARASMFSTNEIESMTVSDASAVTLVGNWAYTAISIIGAGVVKAGNSNIT